jgi:hypothetical protein
MTTYGGYVYLFTSAFTPMTANTPVPLYDAGALTHEILPNGSFVAGVYFDTGSYVDDATISIGWSGNNDGVVPASAGITTTTLNTTGQSYVPSGTVPAVNADTPLTIMTSGNVTSGQINLVIAYQAYSLFP